MPSVAPSVVIPGHCESRRRKYFIICTFPCLFQGSAPHGRSNHTATSIGDASDKVFVIGGRNSQTVFDDIHCLYRVHEAWKWERIKATGDDFEVGVTAGHSMGGQKSTNQAPMGRCRM